MISVPPIGFVTRRPTGRILGDALIGLPNRSSALLHYRGPLLTDIGGLTVLKSLIPSGAHPTVQQVKGSGFAGAGSATAPGLETTDVLTATGVAPTCTLNGVLTFPGPDCWDIYAHRDGVLWAYWAGINVGKTYESDSSGNGHILLNIGGGVTITQRTDGTGTNLVNELGYSIADGGMMFADEAGTLLLPAGTLFTYGYEPSQELVYADGGIELLTNDSLESLYTLVI